MNNCQKEASVCDLDFGWWGWPLGSSKWWRPSPQFCHIKSAKLGLPRHYLQHVGTSTSQRPLGPQLTEARPLPMRHLDKALGLAGRGSQQRRRCGGPHVLSPGSRTCSTSSASIGSACSGLPFSLGGGGGVGGGVYASSSGTSTGGEFRNVGEHR